MNAKRKHGGAVQALPSTADVHVLQRAASFEEEPVFPVRRMTNRYSDGRRRRGR
jgi:hypothetical protein